MKPSKTGAALLFCLLPSPALAAYHCTVSATNIAFGTIQPFGTAGTSSGTVTVTCGGGAGSYTIALSTGGSNSYSPRKMTSGTNKLKYNLYTTSALTTVWGNGTGGTATLNGTVTKSFTVYGSVPTPQGVSPASYTDTITVTATF